MLTCALLLAACASLRPAVETPRLSLADLELVDFGLFEQRYRLELRIQNPNHSALHVRGLDYTLHINDQEFARGLSDQAVDVPAFGEAVVEIDLISSLAGLVAQLSALSDEHMERLPYRLSGRVTLGSLGQARLLGLMPVTHTLPFDYQGELAFPKLNRASRGHTF